MACARYGKWYCMEFYQAIMKKYDVIVNRHRPLNPMGNSLEHRVFVVFTAIVLSLCWPIAGRSAGTTLKTSHIAASKIATRFGFVSYDVKGKQITLRGKFNILEMEGDSRRASFNNVDFWLSGPPARRWGYWTMLQNDVDKMLTPLLNPSAAVKNEDYRVVVLDPGHGGNDKGANDLRRGIQEKQVVLELAKDVRNILKRYNIDARLTRWQDVNLDLDERCQYAAQVRADLFVSIHLNAAENDDSSGIETHILPPTGCPITASSKVNGRDISAYTGNQHDNANMVLGYMLQKSLLKYTHAEDRGVRRSRFQVIKNAPCPAALVECGFISNRKEREKLMNPEYRGRLARALAEGIIAYLNIVKRAHNINA